MEMFDELIRAALSVIGTALASGLVALVLMGVKKVGVSLQADQQAQLEYYARQAVLRVEEIAAARLKAKLRELQPGEKLQLAMTELVAKVPRVDEAEARRIIEAVLPQVGIGAAAGLRELGKAVLTPETRPAA